MDFETELRLLHHRVSSLEGLIQKLAKWTNFSADAQEQARPFNTIIIIPPQLQPQQQPLIQSQTAPPPPLLKLPLPPRPVPVTVRDPQPQPQASQSGSQTRGTLARDKKKANLKSNANVKVKVRRGSPRSNSRVRTKTTTATPAPQPDAKAKARKDVQDKDPDPKLEKEDDDVDIFYKVEVDDDDEDGDGDNFYDDVDTIEAELDRDFDFKCDDEKQPVPVDSQTATSTAKLDSEPVRKRKRQRLTSPAPVSVKDQAPSVLSQPQPQEIYEPLFVPSPEDLPDPLPEQPLVILNPLTPSDLFSPKGEIYPLRYSPLECPICPSQFTNTGRRESLLKHILRHAGKGRCPEPRCRSYFVKQSHLTRHLIRHHGQHQKESELTEKPYKSHKCYFCHSLPPGYLPTHMRKHTRERPYHCLHHRPPTSCRLRFINQAEQRRHSKSAHPNAILPDKSKLTFKCPRPNCAKVVKWANRFNHQLTHSVQKPFKCPYCSRSSRNKNVLKRHIITMHNTENSDKNQDQDQSQSEPRPLPCPLRDTTGCKKTFRFKYQLHQHVRTAAHASEDQIFLCHQCPFTTKASRYLDRHIKEVHHPKTLPSFSCYFCPRMFHYTAHLREHLSIHTGERPFKCAICPYTNGFRNEFTKHVKKAHTQSEGNPFVCTECPSGTTAFRSKNGLDAHLRLHSNSRNSKGNSNSYLRCTTWDCNFEAITREALWRHADEVHHLGEKGASKPGPKSKKKRKRPENAELDAGHGRHQCPHCPKNYQWVDKVGFESHLRGHRGEQPFKCGKCPYATGNSAAWSKHKINCKAYEEGEKITVEECDICGQKFKKGGGVLGRHKKKWHVTQYKCGKCNYSFAEESNLHSHMERKHGGDIEIQAEIETGKGTKQKQDDVEKVNAQVSQSTKSNSNPWMESQVSFASTSIPMPILTPTPTPTPTSNIIQNQNQIQNLTGDGIREININKPDNANYNDPDPGSGFEDLLFFSLVTPH